MMKEVQRVYYNEFGVAFYWIKNGEVITGRVQLIFKETGFYLEHHELTEFKDLIESAFRQYECSNCQFRQACQKVLLKTPIIEVDLAVSREELDNIKDLVEGALFNLNLNDYINNLCRN